MNDAKYTKHPIKQYQYWTSYLYPYQAYLGRCHIALNREGEIDPFTDITSEEQAELEQIITELVEALNKLFQPDIMNYANFRNTWHRCHWHVIPRYREIRAFDGVEFTDKNWGRNYAPYDKNFRISEEIMQKIRLKLMAAVE